MAPVSHSLEKIGRNLVAADFYTLVEKIAEDVVEDVFGIINDHWPLPPLLNKLLIYGTIRG